MSSPTTNLQPCTSNSLGDKPEWWHRQETWQAFVATDDNVVQRKLIIGEAEFSFGLKIAEYPHVVQSKDYESLDEFCDWIQIVNEWLDDHKVDCIAFDTNAVGKYKALSNAVLFRNAEDAMLFKLTWK